MLVLVGILFVAVLPTRTLLQQRRDTAAATAELRELRERNDALEERAARLRDPREIEQLAREQYGLVRPGEEPYVVLPAPPPPEEKDDDEEPQRPRAGLGRGHRHPLDSFFGTRRDRIGAVDRQGTGRV